MQRFHHSPSAYAHLDPHCFHLRRVLGHDDVGVDWSALSTFHLLAVLISILISIIVGICCSCGTQTWA
jgi:hypothetical protein